MIERKYFAQRTTLRTLKNLSYSLLVRLWLHHRSYNHRLGFWV